MSAAVTDQTRVDGGTHRPEAMTARGRSRPGSSVLRVTRMTLFESGMILRQKAALMSIILAPALAIAMALMNRPTMPAAWVSMLASMSILVMVLAVYNTTTSTVVARRESQVLKRLRTSELVPSQMLVSLALPYVVVGVLQIVVVGAAYQFLGAPAVDSYGPFLAVMVGTALLAVIAGFATATIAATSERVQFAVLPVMMTGLVAAIFVLNPAAPDHYRGLALLLPFAASSDLAARALGAPAEMLATPAPMVDLAERIGMSAHTLMGIAAVVVSVLWVVIFAAVARRGWRWEPRG